MEWTRLYDEIKLSIEADEWVFVEDEMMRDQCDPVWHFDFVAMDGKRHIADRRCTREGKFRKRDVYRCGYHTPGVGRKGNKRVPTDLKSKHQQEAA